MVLFVLILSLGENYQIFSEENSKVIESLDIDGIGVTSFHVKHIELISESNFQLTLPKRVYCSRSYTGRKTLNPILPGEGGCKIHPLLFFLHHPKTAQGIKLKLSDFKDTLLRHILQVKPVR